MRLYIAHVYLICAFAIFSPSAAPAAEAVDLGEGVPTLEELRSLLGTERRISVDLNQATRQSPAQAERPPSSPGKVSMRIQFELNSAVITSASHKQVQAMAQYLNSENGTEMRIIGHADALGEAHRNLDLSRQRAYAVHDALTHQYGVSGNRLRVVGMGESEPRYSDPFDPRNRRVEFEVIR